MSSDNLAADRHRLSYRYRPLKFFLITLAGTWSAFFLAAYFSYAQEAGPWAAVFEYAGIMVPGVVALFMVLRSGNPRLKADFRDRLFNLRRIKPGDFLPILLVLPGTLVAATALSLLFGQSAGQFALSPGFSLAGGKAAPLLIGVVLAPVFEELGWRGYGVDSLFKSGRSLLRTSLVFAAFWALWHSPLFIIQGFYWHEVLKEGVIYGANIIVSVLAMAFLSNWVYYRTSRSIPAIVLFHAVNNLSLSMLQTAQVTKCILTLILLVLAAAVIIKGYPGLRGLATPAAGDER